VDRIKGTPEQTQTPPKANDRQVGGDHYKGYGDFQPWDAWWYWNLNPFQAEIVAHAVRYREKSGIEDLRKVIHYAEKLIELETQRVQGTTLTPGRGFR
jgi:hypothetical protein